MLLSLDKLDGKQITFESIRYTDWFVDSRDKAFNEACLSVLPTGKRYSKNRDPMSPDKADKWPLWKIHVRKEEGKEGRVSFESVERSNHFLDLNHRMGWGGMNAIGVTRCANIKKVGNWGQFKIHGTMDDATIQCMRWEDRWLVAHRMRRVMGGKYDKPPPHDSYDGWGHWNIRDVFFGAAEEDAAAANSKSIIHKEWKDSYQDLAEGSSVTETLGMDVGKGTENSEGSSITAGLAIMIGFEAGALFEITAKVENTTSRSTSTSETFNRMRQSAYTLTGRGPGTKLWTPFWLTLSFDDGSFMKVMGKLVETDRTGGSFPDEFNPAKLPDMPSDERIMGAMQSMFQ